MRSARDFDCKVLAAREAAICSRFARDFEKRALRESVQIRGEEAFQCAVELRAIILQADGVIGTG